MFGTSTTSGNFGDEGKTCLIFTSALFTLFFLAKLVAKVRTGHARKSLFSQTNFAFAFKLHQTTAPTFH